MQEITCTQTDLIPLPPHSSTFLHLNTPKWIHFVLLGVSANFAYPSDGGSFYTHTNKQSPSFAN